MTACAFCGRDNDAGATVCVDCGKALPGGGRADVLKSVSAPSSTPRTAASAQVVAQPHAAPPEPTACPFCGAWVNGALPYCPACGRRLNSPGSGPSCARCGSPVADLGVGSKALFCATCGAPVVAASRTLSRFATSPDRTSEPPTVVLALLDETGKLIDRFERRGSEITIGRQGSDISFPDDVFLSPLHAKLSWDASATALSVRDLGSRNGTWVFLEAPHRLLEGDLLLVGSQVIRFRRLGYPGPHSPEADATKRMGSFTPPADIASLTQLRSDGSARDIVQLSPGRDIQIGRERGDWIFPYDPSMSAVHATVRSEDADFVLIDAHSRNGVAVAARGDVPLRDQSRMLLGDKLLRIELPPA